MRKLILALATSVVAIAGAPAANATTFAAWEVTNVAWGDTLNVRKIPASHSQKQAAYPNGTVLQMTARCTGGVDLFEISGKSSWAQRQAVRYRWCEVWHDPSKDGDFVTGWVYGRYIAPY